ncbi:MAG: hypothetical protein AcusKO_01480 [Acuticoccus sp.]
MAERYLLGLDAGNTVIKAVLFDMAGRQVAIGALDGHSMHPAPGHVERDLDELWRNAQTAIHRCLAAAAVDPAAIAAIGCAGHGNGLYALDAAGAPVVGIQSLDARAAPLAAALDAAAGAALYPLALQRPWPAQTPTLMAWLARHRPDLWERIATVFLCKDFITYRLTGERVSDVSDMSGCGLVRLPDGAYDDALLAHYGLDGARERLPRLVEPADIAGRISPEAAAQTGLAAGTPVIGGFFDVVSSAMGGGRRARRRGVDHRRKLEHQPGVLQRTGGGRAHLHGLALRRQPLRRHRIERHLGRQPRMVRARLHRARRPPSRPVRRRDGVPAIRRAGGRTTRSSTPSSTVRATMPRAVPASTASPAGTRGAPSQSALRGCCLRAQAPHRPADRRRAHHRAGGPLSGGGARSPVWPQIFADVHGASRHRRRGARDGGARRRHRRGGGAR